jgi:hypothetical protein
MTFAANITPRREQGLLTLRVESGTIDFRSLGRATDNRTTELSEVARTPADVQLPQRDHEKVLNVFARLRANTSRKGGRGESPEEGPGQAVRLLQNWLGTPGPHCSRILIYPAVVVSLLAERENGEADVDPPCPQQGGADPRISFELRAQNLLVRNLGRCRRPSSCLVDSLVSSLPGRSRSLRCGLTKGPGSPLRNSQIQAQPAAGGQLRSGCVRARRRGRPQRQPMGTLSAGLSGLAFRPELASNGGPQSAATPAIHRCLARATTGVLRNGAAAASPQAQACSQQPGCRQSKFPHSIVPFPKAGPR